MQKLKSNLAARIFKIELRTFLLTCEELNTPRTLACYLLVKNGEYEQYLALEPNYDSETFADDYLVTEMLRKNPNLPINLQPRKAAVDTWHKNEANCALSNNRLSLYSQGLMSPVDKEVSTIVHKTIGIISSILGPLTREKLDFMESKFAFGPGSSSAVSGVDVIESKKYTCVMHVTPRLYPYINAIRTSSKEVELRAFSKVTFVSKTAKTDRAIAIEPHMNIFVQKGIGVLLRKMLKKTNLDLDIQADVNRRLASKAHTKGYSTVDLTSASDNISRELVHLLLPFEWASLLDVARTEYSVLDGVEHRLEKFSSMGNGFTFELESLIFLAVCRATGADVVSVFGDDIIINREKAPLLVKTLNFLGFDVNSKKTFMDGVFFESCGSDYYNGRLVRPFYLKGAKYEFSTSVIRICNKIRRYSHLRNGFDGCDIRFFSVWQSVLRTDDRANKTYISDQFGDSGIIRNFDECKPSLLRHGHEGYLGRVINIKMKQFNVSSSIGALAAALHRGCREQAKSTSGSRQFKTTAVGNMVIPLWYNLGPWKRTEVLALA